jgi:hypothetical protein
MMATLTCTACGLRRTLERHGNALLGESVRAVRAAPAFPESHHSL